MPVALNALTPAQQEVMCSEFLRHPCAENLFRAHRRSGRGPARQPQRATIADLCNLVVEDNRLRNLRDARHVEWRYKANVAPVLGCLLASRFGQAQVRLYIASQPQRWRFRRSINRELAIVRRGFKLGAGETATGAPATGDTGA